MNSLNHGGTEDTEVHKDAAKKKAHLSTGLDLLRAALGQSGRGRPLPHWLLLLRGEFFRFVCAFGAE
jgi:hypothetical protein